MSENQKKVYEKPEVTIKESQIEIYPGIIVIADKNYIPRNELKREDISKFSKVKVEISAKFVHIEKDGKKIKSKSNVKRDTITFKVYPVQTSKDVTEVICDKNVKLYLPMFRLNDDISNNVRLNVNTYTQILLAHNLSISTQDREFSILRYARFVTSVKEGKRYYRLQLFLSFAKVINLWLSEEDVSTLSSLVQAKLINPVIFYQATSQDLDLEEKPVLDDLI